VVVAMVELAAMLGLMEQLTQVAVAVAVEMALMVGTVAQE
jgi:hypothetical protein